MCGRTACSLDPEALKRVCNVSHFVNSHHYSPSYNICPSTFIPVLLLQSQLHQYYVLNHSDSASTSTDDSKTEDTPKTAQSAHILSAMRWGLVPSFSKNGKMTFNTINARQDTVCSKPMYRRLVNRKRCVVVMNGYYEWKTTTTHQGKEKQPYFFTPKYSADGKGKQDEVGQLGLEPPLMYMAALWDVWKSKEDPLAPPLFTVTVITTASSDDVSFCHHRMPLLMTRECVDRWVDVERYSIEQCFGMIAESQSGIAIRNKAVPRKIVGNVRNKGIECIQSVEEMDIKVRKGGLHRFFGSAKCTKKKGEEKRVEIEGDSRGKEGGSGMDIDSQTEDEMDHGMMDKEMKEAIAASKRSYDEEQRRGKKRRFETQNGHTLTTVKRQKLNDGNPSKK